MTKEIELNGKEVAENVDKGVEEQTTEDKQENRIPYERFKQKVDEANALKEKLAAYEKEQDEAKRKELEKQNEYKALYEQALQEKEQARQDALRISKSHALLKAGYADEQAELLVKLVDGEDDEAIAESIKRIQATIPVQDNYADPSAFNGAKAKPKTADAEEIGRDLYERIKHKVRG